MDIVKEARIWIKDNYPLMNADDFDQCVEVDVYDMIKFADYVIKKMNDCDEIILEDGTKISQGCLKMMNSSLFNLKKGIASEPINTDELEDLLNRNEH